MTTPRRTTTLAVPLGTTVIVISSLSPALGRRRAVTGA